MNKENQHEVSYEVIKEGLPNVTVRGPATDLFERRSNRTILPDNPVVFIGFSSAFIEFSLVFRWLSLSFHWFFVGFH